MTTLIIAYGNRLRGDDGAGPAVGDAVASWQLPSVQVIVTHQLVPELVDDIKEVKRVLFVDAAAALRDGAYAAETVRPARSRCALGHQQTPAALLGLLQELEGKVPPAWVLTVAATSFEHGEELSEKTAANVQRTLDWIRGWLRAVGIRS